MELIRGFTEQSGRSGAFCLAAQGPLASQPATQKVCRQIDNLSPIILNISSSGEKMRLILVFSLTVLGISARPQKACDPIFEECADPTTTTVDPIFDQRSDAKCDPNDPIFCDETPRTCFEDINEIEDSSDDRLVVILL